MDNRTTYPVLRRPTALFLLACLFILTRVSIIIHPDSAVWYDLVDELTTGNVAYDMESSDLMPLPLYQTKPFAAGTMMIGLLSRPFRLVFGPNLFALKMTAVAWNLLAMLLWTILAWRMIGKTGALVVGVLHAIPPPFYGLISTTAWGNHCEVGLFAALMLLALHASVGRIGTVGEDIASARSASQGRDFFIAMAGLAAGFGVYFSFTGIIAFLFGIFVLFFVGGRTAIVRRAGLYLLGGLIGAAPLLYSVKYYRWAAIGRIDTYTGYSSGAMVTIRRLFLESGASEVLHKFFAFWSRDLWNSILFQDTQAVLLSGPVFFALIAILCAAIPIAFHSKLIAQGLSGSGSARTRDETHRLFRSSMVFYILLFSVLYSLSGFRVLSVDRPELQNFYNYRYLVPVMPFLFLVLGNAAQELWNAASEKRALRGVLLVLFGFFAWRLGLYYTEILPSQMPRDQAWLYRGEDPLMLAGRKAAESTKSYDGFGVRPDELVRLHPEEKGLLLELMSRVSEQGFEKARRYAQGFGADFRPVLYRGLGCGIAENLFKPEDLTKPRAFLETVAQKAAIVPDAFLADFIEGIGWGMSIVSQESAAHLVAGVSTWDIPRADWKDWMKIGIGRKIGSGLHVDFKAGGPEDEFYFIGVGAQLRRNVEIYCTRFDAASSAVLEASGARRQAMIRGFLREGREYFPMELYDRTTHPQN